MSFILISLFNTRFPSHLVSFHFFFFNKKKKKKILCNFTSDLLLCLRISDLKCGQKTPKRMGPWRKTFPFFWSHLLSIISRNVGMKGHLKKEIVLLKYQLCNFTSDLLLCLRISDLKCGQKTPKRMGPWRKTFPFFWSHLLSIISRNVGMKGHLKKEIVLLKYQFFRFMTKSGGQFELLNWLEKSTRLLMLEDYDIVHFTIC